MSGILNGKDLVLYIGKDLRPIGCEATCTLSMQRQEIITTTKGSGAATNREYGSYDWQITSNGVIFINDSFSGSVTIDPTEMGDILLKGLKVCAKMKIENGATDKYYFGNGIITSAEYAGTAGQHVTYSITIKADGKLYRSSNLISETSFSEGIIILSSTTYGAGYSSISLLNNTIVAIFVDDILTTDYTFNPASAGSGVIDFVPDIASGKTIEIIHYIG